MSDAIKAMIEWCNEQGGINGREVDGQLLRRQDPRGQQRHDRRRAPRSSCSSARAGSLDSGQEETRAGCGLPAVPGYAVSPAFANGPDMVQPVPEPGRLHADRTSPAAIAESVPGRDQEDRRRCYANYPATVDTRRTRSWRRIPQSASSSSTATQVYNIAGEADWKPFAQKLKDCGAEVVYFAGSPYPNFENFLDAANQLDYHPIYMTDANFYDEAFADVERERLRRQGLHARGVPAARARRTRSRRSQDYIDIVDQVGGDVNQLGAQATSSFLLWATAAKACGADVTRECVLERDRRRSTSGPAAASTPRPTRATNMPPKCGMVLKLRAPSSSGSSPTRSAPWTAATTTCSPSPDR